MSPERRAGPTCAVCPGHDGARRLAAGLTAAPTRCCDAILYSDCARQGQGKPSCYTSVTRRFRPATRAGQRCPAGGGAAKWRAWPVTGWRKPRRRGVQRLAREGEQGVPSRRRAGAAPRRGCGGGRPGRPPAGGRHGPGGRGSGGCGRCAAGSAAGRRRRRPGALRPVAGERRLAAALGVRTVSTAMRLRSAGWRPIGASISPGRRLGQAPGQGEVFAVEVALGEGGGQGAVGALGLGHDHDAGGVLVEPVDDAGPASRRRCRAGPRRHGPAGR